MRGETCQKQLSLHEECASSMDNAIWGRRCAVPGPTIDLSWALESRTLIATVGSLHTRNSRRIRAQDRIRTHFLFKARLPTNGEWVHNEGCRSQFFFDSYFCMWPWKVCTIISCSYYFLSVLHEYVHLIIFAIKHSMVNQVWDASMKKNSKHIRVDFHHESFAF